MAVTKTRRGSARGDVLVRIDKHTDSTLSMLAKERHEDKKKVLAYSVEKLRRDSMIEKLCAGFSELRNDRDEWAKELAEREAWQEASSEVLSNE